MKSQGIGFRKISGCGWQVSLIFTFVHKLEQWEGHLEAAVLFSSNCNPYGYMTYE